MRIEFYENEHLSIFRHLSLLFLYRIWRFSTVDLAFCQIQIFSRIWRQILSQIQIWPQPLHVRFLALYLFVISSIIFLNGCSQNRCFHYIFPNTLVKVFCEFQSALCDIFAFYVVITYCTSVSGATKFIE